MLAAVDPLLMRHLIDSELPTKAGFGAALTVVALAACFLGRSFFGGLSGLLSFRVSQSLGQNLRVQMLGHMSSLSADWHERVPLGEKLSRLDQDVLQISPFGADFTTSVVRALVFFCTNLIIMFTLNWRMTMSVLLLFPLFVLVRHRFRSAIQHRADRAQDTVGRSNADVAEHLGAIPELQVLGAATFRLDRSILAWLGVVQSQWEQRKTEIAFSVVVSSVLALAILCVLGFGVREYFVHMITLGGLVAFYAYVTRIFDPLSTAMEVYSRSQRMLASARRVQEVLHETPTVPDEGVIPTVELPLRGGLRGENLTFAYESGQDALRGISARIRPGERVAIVGRSGSGRPRARLISARVSSS